MAEEIENINNEEMETARRKFTAFPQITRHSPSRAIFVLLAVMLIISVIAYGGVDVWMIGLEFDTCRFDRYFLADRRLENKSISV